MCLCLEDWPVDSMESNRETVRHNVLVERTFHISFQHNYLYSKLSENRVETYSQTIYRFTFHGPHLSSKWLTTSTSRPRLPPIIHPWSHLRKRNDPDIWLRNNKLYRKLHQWTVEDVLSSRVLPLWWTLWCVLPWTWKSFANIMKLDSLCSVLHANPLESR